jgi:hypothetical protein
MLIRIKMMRIRNSGCDAQDLFSRKLTWSLLFRYDPSIGIYGMDFYVVLGRPGMNIPHRYVHRQRKEDEEGTGTPS